jgi:hypothetical protein
MLLSVEGLRLLLSICLLGLVLIAAFFLRGRKLTMIEYLGWGMVVIFVPLLGPFLVIVARPGRPRQ